MSRRNPFCIVNRCMEPSALEPVLILRISTDTTRKPAEVSLHHQCTCVGHQPSASFFLTQALINAIFAECATFQVAPPAWDLTDVRFDPIINTQRGEA